MSTAEVLPCLALGSRSEQTVNCMQDMLPRLELFLAIADATVPGRGSMSCMQFTVSLLGDQI